MKDIFRERRVSCMELNEMYFWTNTINGWKHLLKSDKYKQYIIDSWRKLVHSGHISVYAFVIMPNHLHAIWELHKLNGKEMPHASFNKETAHNLIKDIKLNYPKALPFFSEEAKERKHRIWQRDPMAIHMDTLRKVNQKIDYIHNNPLAEHWNLAKTPEEYYWSSASFYHTGKTDFDFLSDYRELF